MSKFKEWFLNGGQQFLDFIVYLLGFVILFLFIWFISALIRNIPLFVEECVEQLLSIGGQLP